MNPIKTLAIEDYRAVHDPDLLGFDATDSLRPTKEIIGQESLTDYTLIKLYETDRYPRTAELTTEALKSAILSGSPF